MAGRLRWGVLATGAIAEEVAPGLLDSKVNELIAVASRSIERAREFADRHGLSRALGSYEELLADPDIDCVYICLPNSLHYEWVNRALDAGKHVLCEKPLTPTAVAAEELFAKAESREVVLGEAFMFRYHPKTLTLKSLVRGGVLGEVHTIRSSFCYWAEDPDSDVRFRTDLDGGALLDVGSYSVTASNLIADAEPTDVQAFAIPSASGVDERFYGLMQYESGTVAQFDVSMRSPLSLGLQVLGTLGEATVAMPWYAHRAPHTIDVSLRNGEVWSVENSQESAYRCETEAFGQTVSGLASLEVGPRETVRNIRTMERLKAAATSP